MAAGARFDGDPYLDAVYEGSLFVPESAGAGTERVRVAVLEPRTRKPAVRVGIAGLGADGWYEVGTVEVR